MKVRAIATGTERSNAIGAIELECAPQGLAMTYLGVGAYAEGYAPGALTRGTQVQVPWPDVLEARAEGDQLFLAVAPRWTPHHRLSLSGFSSGDVIDPRELFRQRLILWLGAGGAAVIGMLLVALTVPRISPEAGGGTAVALGAFTALVLLAVGWIAEIRLSRAADPETARRALLGDLSCYLPHLTQSPHPPPRVRREPLLLVHQLMPRTTMAFAVTLSAGLLGAILTMRWVLMGGAAQRHEPRPAVATQSQAPTATVAEERHLAAASAPAPDPNPDTSAPALPTGDAVGLGEDCRCLRADSPLWRDGLPRLSTLILAQRGFQRGSKRRLAAEVAVVNNGDKPLVDVSLLVRFFEQDPPPSNKRYEVAQRALFFEGPLEAAQAIKWSVDARGTSLEVEAPDAGTIVSPGVDTAPTNFIADLLHANHRPVRMHGAMLLAYLGDPRARQAATDLRDALRDDEEPYLMRLLRATEDVRVCDLQVTGDGASRAVSGCLFNAGASPATGAGVRVRALDDSVSHQHPLAPPPTVTAEQKWQVPQSLAPNSGRRFSAVFSLRDATGATPTFEGYAGRFDLLD